CERDRFQKQHEENLASASLELNKSQQSQLEAARSSHQRAIATRDATIAALKDDLDKQQLSLQEELDTWRNKWRICRGSWLKLGANQSVRFWGKVSVAGVGGVPGSKAAWPRQPQAPTVEGDSCREGGGHTKCEVALHVVILLAFKGHCCSHEAAERRKQQC
ncbi:putative Golgin subfamily A member 4-like 2, partial [Homarus americanus]